MKSLKQSCLRWAILYFTMAAAATALVYTRFPRFQIALGAGFGAAIFLWFAIGYIAGVGSRASEAALIRRAMQGGRPDDGEKIAVIGTIYCAEALESPITRRRSVAYEYAMIPPERESAPSYDGFALAPSRIDGPRGSIRLLAYPELAIPDEFHSSPQQYQNARDYIARTTFTAHEGIDFGREMKHLKTLLADDDGRIRYDIRRDVGTDISHFTLKEKLIAPGDSVCAIGRYSATRGGLVPDETAMLHPVKILRGEPATLMRQSGAGRVGHTLLGLGCLLPVVAAALIALVVVPLTAIEQMLPDKDPSWTEVRLERLLDRKVRGKVARAFSLDVSPTAIVMERGEARGKLSSGGTTVHLRSSYAKRDGDTTQVWLMGDGAPAPGVRLRFSGESLNSLQVIGGETIIAPDADVEQLQSTDQDIRGRITYLDPTDRVLLRAAFWVSQPPH